MKRTALDYSGFGFKVGKAFNRRKAENNDEYLKIAVKTHDYLESVKVVTEDGIYWNTPGNENKNGSYYNGSAGVLYYYLQLYEITNDDIYLDRISLGADLLHKHWKETVNAAKAVLLEYGIEEDTGIGLSYYSGITGIAEVLIVLYEKFKREKDLQTVIEITDFLVQSARYDSDGGISWASDRTMAYDAGIALYLFHASEFLKDEKLYKLADLAFTQIVNEAIADERGGYAWKSTLHVGVDRVPNFEGGTAGVGYALAAAYKQTGKREYLDAAIEAAKHIKAISVKMGDGFLVPWHDDPNEKPIFYVSNCHGPAGTSKLFYELYKITDNKAYLEDIKGLYRGLRFLNVPEKMSAGYWNSVCVCCGAAGLLQFFINLAIVFADEEFGRDAKDAAEIAAEILIGEQESKAGGREGVWPIAYDRIIPDKIKPEYGYFTGASGISGALLELFLYENGRFALHRLADDPFPESWGNGK